jgi:hypothetical protein
MLSCYMSPTLSEFQLLKFTTVDQQPAYIPQIDTVLAAVSVCNDMLLGPGIASLCAGGYRQGYLGAM